MIDRCSVDPATPELATRYTYDATPEDFEALELSAEDDAKLTKAARPNLIIRALAGEQDAMDDLRRLHLTYWSKRP